MGVPLVKEALGAGDFRIQPELHPHGLAQGDILFNGLVPDAEGGNHMADNAAQGVPALKNGS